MSERTSLAVGGSPSTRFSIAARLVGGWLRRAGRTRRPRRNQHRRSVGAAGRIRILIGPDVDAAIARALDQRHRRRARAPVVLALGLEMRGHDARAGLLADLDRFAHRIEQRRRGRSVLARHVPERIAAFAALVRDVDAVARPAARARARSTSSVVLQRPGFVFESRRHPDRAFLQRLPHERAHARDLVRPRRPPHIVTHHAAAHRAVADEQHRVGADAGLLQLRALIGDRPRRSAVLVDDHGGDALRHEIRRRSPHRIRIAKSAARSRPIVGVRVDVDEAGRDVLAAGVDRARRLRVRQRCHRDDAAALHGDVGGEPGIAGAVEDARRS